MLRTVVLWIVLIVLFVAFYNVFANHPDGEGGGPDGLLSLATWMPWLAILIFLVIFGVLVARQRGAYREHNDAHTQLAEGRVLEALAGFEAARKRMKNPIPVMNVGYSQLLLWRVNEAAASFELFAKKSGALNGVPGGEKLVAPSAALANALLGRRDLAQAWIAKSPGTAAAKLAGIVIACRAGDFEGASRLLQENEVVLDQLGGTLRALAETVSAYVASKTGGRGGTVDPVRMFRESSVDVLKPVWPELHEFVVRVVQGPQFS